MLVNYLIALAVGAVLELLLITAGIRDASGLVDVLVVAGPACGLFGLRHPTFVLPFYFFIGTLKNLPGLKSAPGNLSIAMGLFVACCCGAHLLVDRRRSLAGSGIVVFVALVGLILVAYGRSTMPLIAYEKLLYLATFVVVSFVAPMLLVVDRDRIEELFKGFMVVAVLVLAGMFLATERGTYLDERLGMAGASSITSGVALVVGAVTALYWWLPQAGGNLQRGLAVLLALACLGGLITTGSRGPFLFGLMTLGFGLLAHARTLTRNLINNVARVALVGLCITLAVWGFRASFLAKEFGGAERSMSIVSEDWQQVIRSNDRVWLMGAAVEMVRERPLLGFGLGGYQRALSRSDEWDYTYPHNLLLDIGCEAGLPAALLLVVLYALAFRGTAVRIFLRPPGGWLEPSVLCVSLILLFTFLEGMVSNDVFRARMEWGAIGLALAVGVLAQRHDPGRVRRRDDSSYNPRRRSP